MNCPRCQEPAQAEQRFCEACGAPLFEAAAEATEEAILNAMTAAETMTGQHRRISHALPLDRLQEVMRRYGRGCS